MARSPNIKFEIDASGMKKLGQRIRNNAEKKLRQGGLLIEANADGRAPDRSSNLVNSGVVNVYGRGLGTVVEIVYRAGYSAAVHEGTGLHGPRKRKIVIKPRVKKALSWPGARHPVKKVENPGQKPQPFLRDAMQEEYPEILKSILE